MVLGEFSALLPKRGKKHARTDVINRVVCLCISKEIPGPGYDAQEDNVSFKSVAPPATLVKPISYRCNIFSTDGLGKKSDCLGVAYSLH